jgi:hypothetical protein
MADGTGDDVAELLAPAFNALRSRQRDKSAREQLRESIVYAVMNADCVHQDAISLADAECIAEAVLLAIVKEGGEA